MPILLWLLGIPIPLIILIMLLHRARSRLGSLKNDGDAVEGASPNVQPMS